MEEIVKIEDERKRKLLKKTVRMLEEFRKVDEEMSVQQMMTFMAVVLAGSEGIRSSDIASMSNNTQSAVSRHVAVLGEFGRGKTEPLNVVKATTNPQ